MARLLLMLACVVSGGAALAQSYEAQTNRQILNEQRLDAQQIQRQQSNERALQSYDLRNRAINNSRRQVDTFRPTYRPGVGNSSLR